MNKELQIKLASVLAALGMSVASGAMAAELPRGADIDPLAGNCGIAKFPQTSKAGPYNALCDVMQDNEKCLALIKGQYNFDGQKVTVEKFYQSEVPKARYCLDVLKRDLGLNQD